jgi:hypothetical protein
MRTVLWLLLAALALCGRTQAQGDETRLLTGFEDDADELPWRLQGALAVRATQHATQGRHALQVTLLPGKYPGLLLDRESPLLAGWDDYDLARLDVFNPQSQPVPVTVRIDDQQSVNFGSRYNEGFVMRPGKNTIELPLRRLQTSDHKRNLDVSQLGRFMIFATDVQSPVALFLDNFRLEKTPVPASGGIVRAFDFGPRGSPVMEGFVGVTEADQYDKARGWGWITSKYLAAFDDELPDSLCRDYVRLEEGRAFTTTFAVDVPNGAYEVIGCMRNPRLTDPYHGIDHDWWPDKDVWKEEILPKFPERVSRVTVTNGQITLTFTNVAVYWLAVLPSDNNWLDSLNAARRREFYEKYFYLEPYKPSANPTRIKLAAARGQTVSAYFSCESGLPSATGFPAGVNVHVRAVRLMERPVGRGVYRVEEMALMSLTNRLHARRFALTAYIEPTAEPGLYRGEVAGMPIELRIWPFELPSACDLDITYGWYYDPSSDPAMRDREFRDMVEHGFNSVTAIRPVVRSDGSLDTRRADEFLVAAQRSGVVGEHPVPIETLGIARRLSHLLGAAEFSDQFLRTYQRALVSFRDWTVGKVFPVLAYVVDEPREQALNPWNRSFEDTRRYLELHRAAGLRTMVTLTGDRSFGKSYLPLLKLLDVVSVHATESSRGILDATRDGQPALWLYNAGMNRFTFGFLPWATGATGRWEWHYEWWTQAYDPFARVEENPWSTGCGAVMPSPDGPLPTVAYENVRAGIDDYRYVFLLKRLIRKCKGGKVDEAEHFLKEIRSRIPRFLDGATVEEATLDVWREKIAGFIVALAEEAERNHGTDSGRPPDPPQRP